MEIVLTNRPTERKRLLQALQSFAAEHRLPVNVLQAADLALEEHLTNVFNYAYADTTVHEIRVRLGAVDETDYRLA